MEDVAECLWGIIENMEPLEVEKVIDGYRRFLSVDKDCNLIGGVALETPF